MLTRGGGPGRADRSALGACTLALFIALAYAGEDEPASISTPPPSAQQGSEPATPLARRLEDAETELARSGPAAALPLFQRALAEAISAGDASAQARALRQIGGCHRGLGDYAAASSSLAEALALARSSRDRLEEGKSLSLLGLVDWDRGEFDRAESQFRSAIEMAQELQHRHLEASALNNLSLVLDERGRYAESLAGYERALQLYAEDPLPRGEADTLANIGGVHLLLGRYEKALESYRKALELDTAIGSAPAIGLDHGNIGQALEGLGEYARADAEFVQAIDAARTASQPVNEAFWLKARANAQYKLGNYDTALDFHRASLELYSDTGARAEELEARADYGELLLHLGDLAGAERQFRQAHQTASAIALHRGETQTLLRLGDLHRYRNEPQAALDRYRASLARAEAVDDQARRAESLVRMAEVQLQLGQAREAGAAAEQARRVAEAQHLPWQAAQAGLQQALVLEHAGDHAAARARFAATLQDAEALGDPDLLWRAHYGLGRCHVAAGERTEAIRELEAAVAVIENVQARLQQPRYRSGYLDDKYEVYVELVRQLTEAGNVGRAFEVSEDLRAQTARDLQPRPEATSIANPELASRETRLRERVRTLQDRLQAEQVLPALERRQSAVEGFSRELAQAEREYAELLDDARATHSLQRPRADQARLRAALHRDEALIGYVVGTAGLTVFVLRSDRLDALQVSLKRKDLRARIELLRELVLDPGNEAWRLPASSLSDVLIRPLRDAGWLDGVTRLNIVPDAELNYLPFTLLPLEAGAAHRLLVQDYVISLLPSASMLASRSDDPQSGSQRLLALSPASARLRHADAEVRAITALRGDDAEAWTGATATEQRFKEHAGRYSLLHLATHGEFNSLNPSFSALELEPGGGEDGKLQVQEILRMRLDASLVTLSACNTALGSGYFTDVPVGNDFVGLTSAFLQAGSRNVLSSLWAVDDHFTSRFMVELYAAAHEADFAHGLSAAQRGVLVEGGSYAHPFYWAPYVLIGPPGVVPAPGPDGKVAAGSVQQIRPANFAHGFAYPGG